MFLLPTARNGRVDAPLQITEIHRPRRLRLDGTRLLHAVEHAPAVLVEEGRPDGAGATAGVDVASGLLDDARVPVQVGHGLDRISGPDDEVHPGVHFMVWTAYPIKAMADLNGYTRIIEEAGGHIYTGSCPCTIGPTFLDKYSGCVFDSVKQAVAVKSETARAVYLGDLQRCIDAAVAGRWEEEHRWTRSR